MSAQPNGEVLWANKASQNYTGLSPSEIVGTDAADILPMASKELLRHALLNASKDPPLGNAQEAMVQVCVPIPSHSYPNIGPEWEVAVDMKGGSPLTTMMSVTAAPMIDANGKSPGEGVMVAFGECGPLVAQIAQLKEELAILKDFIDGLNAVVIGTDSLGNITRWNTCCENFIGLAADSVIGQSFTTNLVSAED